MDMTLFNKGLLDFLQQSPTPFHAVAAMQTELDDQGFNKLEESASWGELQPGRYYVTRNDSSLIAFVVGSESVTETGLRLVGAHTDSPCLKVKPKPEINSQGYFQLGVEVYGGALLNPWFDRDLSLTGKVVYRNGDGKLCKTLVNFDRPVAIIPSLAIHLDREANKDRTINPQTDIPPVIFQAGDGRETDFRKLLADAFVEIDGEVLEYDLFFYDCAQPSIVGLYDEFIASARLDNLLSCYTGLQSLLESDGSVTAILVCNDHEEVGSMSACGAQGPMLKDLLARLLPNQDQRSVVLANSLMVSADNAHGVHPNYSDKHDNNHGPVLNRGPVIKINGNQRYATSSETASLFRQLAQQVDAETQVFVNRTDLGCGSTIGPITAAEIGVATLDVGVPTFAMHSIRELAGVEDAHALYRVLSAFNNCRKPLRIV